jgi:Protein of unknown function (DUF2946)
MDEIVKQAMAKWPNVPHCYGWLALDARGGWRMRDEAAQRDALPGDRLTNATLVGFINRNYLRDERGCWYFQNGPQRVYVALETTPFVARTDPATGFMLQTGQPLSAPERAYVTEQGQVILLAGEIAAQVDDRDTAQVLAWLERDRRPLPDEMLMDWIERGEGPLELRIGERRVVAQRIASGEMTGRFGFVRNPAP